MGRPRCNVYLVVGDYRAVTSQSNDVGWWAGSDVAIIVVSAKGQVDDRILGLQSGADDYLVKPFNIDELLARVQAVLRRRSIESPVRPELLRVGDIEIDLPRHEVARCLTERHDRADPEPRDGQRQQRVKRQAPGAPGALLDVLGRLDGRRGPDRTPRHRRGALRAPDHAPARGWGTGRGHAQNVFEAPDTKRLGLPNHCEASRRAIGAAVSAPKPPCSTVTAITIGRDGSGT